MLKKLQTLQAGRALAAISVAAFHLSIMMGSDRYVGQEVFREYTLHGKLGVDFFFVLSGFIILLVHINDIGKPNKWGVYLYRRFARLFPIYWIYTCTFALLILTTGISNPETVAKLPQSLSEWITSLSLIRFNDADPPLSMAWTLFHELAFYAAFSILILNYRIGIVLIGFLMLSSMILYSFPKIDERTPFNVYTSAYNLHFLFGMGAMLLYRRGGRGIIELAIGICIVLLASITMPLPHGFSLTTFAFGFALILAGATKLELSGQLYIPLFLRLIGDASYTIYLTHIALQGLLLKILIKIDLHQIIGNEATYFFVLTGTIAIGCIIYLAIEKPLLTTLQLAYERKTAR